jgi:hypothetical protein
MPKRKPSSSRTWMEDVALSMVSVVKLRIWTWATRLRVVDGTIAQKSMLEGCYCYRAYVFDIACYALSKSGYDN